MLSANTAERSALAAHVWPFPQAE